ncbi:Probable RNA-directed DNA polymerase from transposon BS [Eumeta japonica]|uniref:Probable RNA-directed DNA polymerase from transposon BS n=1 Tax=Eumeta variegata TaxID=151549 RepID=A0A4C2A2N1_EUMVA|nr:Probable RNA-directed DNA polymerase from transposon BS [Eumeta japonica]
MRSSAQRMSSAQVRELRTKYEVRPGLRMKEIDIKSRTIIGIENGIVIRIGYGHVLDVNSSCIAGSSSRHALNSNTGLDIDLSPPWGINVQFDRPPGTDVTVRPLPTLQLNYTFFVQIAPLLRPATLLALPFESPLPRWPPRSTDTNTIYYFRLNNEKSNVVNDVICSEGFKTKQKTVAVFFDVAKAFDRVWHAEVPQGSALSPLLYSAYTNYIPRPTSGVQLAFFTDDTELFYKSRTRCSIFRHLPRAIDELGQWFRKWRIEPYKYLGVTLDKNLHFREHIARVRKNALFYTARLGAMLATDAHWCVRNSILHRNLELPTLPKYMKDTSKRFFDIAESRGGDYQPPPPTHFIRRPRNVLIDPPAALTAAVDTVNDTHD